MKTLEYLQTMRIINWNVEHILTYNYMYGINFV